MQNRVAAQKAIINRMGGGNTSGLPDILGNLQGKKKSNFDPMTNIEGLRGRNLDPLARMAGVEARVNKNLGKKYKRQMFR